MKHRLWYYEKTAHKNNDSHAGRHLLEPIFLSAVVWHICGIVLNLCFYLLRNPFSIDKIGRYWKL